MRRHRATPLPEPDCKRGKIKTPGEEAGKDVRREIVKGMFAVTMSEDFGRHEAMKQHAVNLPLEKLLAAHPVRGEIPDERSGSRGKKSRNYVGAQEFVQPAS